MRPIGSFPSNISTSNFERVMHQGLNNDTKNPATKVQRIEEHVFNKWNECPKKVKMIGFRIYKEGLALT